MSDSGAATTTNNGNGNDQHQAGPSNPTSPTLLSASSPKSPLNGEMSHQQEQDDATPSDPAERISQLEEELSATRQENEKLSGQYRGLLGKLTAMRTTLGDKLKEDAEELDRRENTINNLSTENSALQETLANLQNELRHSSEEASNLSAQLNQLRSQSDSSSSDVLSLTREMRELRGEIERIRIEKEEWELEFGNERQKRENIEDEYAKVERTMLDQHTKLERAQLEVEEERERANNLQEVLSEFQIAKDSELRQATSELETQLRLAATSSSEFKLRCANAETKLSEVSSSAGKVGSLEREMREKNVLIGKLRHDAVVNNEHLTEALRRLRKNSSDNNVDRRLVTNILLSFLTTSRGDTKRFEMLSLLSTILSWDDNEREKAGLQRKGGTNLNVESKGRRASGKEKERTAEEEAAMNESFSNLFVEFLLKEASQGQTRSSVSSPTPTDSTLPHPHRTFSQTSLNSPSPFSPATGSTTFSPPPINQGLSMSGTTTPYSRPRGLSNSSYTSERPSYGTGGRKISGGLRDVLNQNQNQSQNSNQN
ncbi:uncharacterized protein I303_103080 [Kwoniella dejecticola CBS 10117]|uniref:GRIP domain-containing protein n=1 Tax=Kwoniella dejecticola CBS 10117 TaxID=1296121 RepID=A0A1A6AAI5_9TREE|nr:uncharacterized protein I303_03100 [Kwoniella dejecticola CBS 10117]OBR87077.1 hypothetical protein I303_03100 [Kwoniella dejecticola CBS 10117]